MSASSSLSVLFRDDIAGRELQFAEPADLLIAQTPDEFYVALEAAERARRTGKWLAGYFSYECGYLFEPKLRARLPQNRRVPLICLGVFDDLVVRDTTVGSPGHTYEPVFASRPAWAFADYEKRFDCLHDHLRKGDCYQGNLTFPVHARWAGHPREAFDILTVFQPVRYGALVSLGDPVILSRSPELFFEVDADRFIETLPMKGTAPRGKTEEEDQRLKALLMKDPKTQAENRMIVDLLRNDVSRISEIGTLDVPELFRVESYPTVHQMVSRVRAKLLPDLTIAEIFAALFPCGSVTGAPKIRAMEILQDLEGTPRDAYCGAIGWVAPNGTMRFNVAIRTISLFQDGEAIYNVGGGVIFDSSAEGEYAECLLKARFVTNPDGLGASCVAEPEAEASQRRV